MFKYLSYRVYIETFKATKVLAIDTVLIIKRLLRNLEKFHPSSINAVSEL